MVLPVALTLLVTRTMQLTTYQTTKGLCLDQEMPQRTLDSDSISICVVDSDPSALRTTGQLLSSAGYSVKPFSHQEAFLEYASIHRPKVAIVTLGRSHTNGLPVTVRLREVSPATFVIIALKVHRGRAHHVLLGNELVSLIEQYRISKSTQTAATRGSFPHKAETEIACCA